MQSSVFTRGKLWAWAAGLAIVALVAAACGGGEEAPPTATTQPTATPTQPAVAATPTPRPTATPTPAPTPTPTPVRPKTGGVFNVRVSGSFANEWDNYTAAGRFAVLITQNLLNNITIIDPVDGSSIRPDLAESFAVSADGKTVTYNVRKGVLWHDGAPFTAKDIVHSLNRARNPESPAASLHKSRLAIVASVEAPDDATVRVTLSKPSASFLTVASAPNLTIYPAHAANITAWKANPFGTGPFKFKSLEKDKQSELTRNDKYFKKDEFGNALPYLDGLFYHWIADQALAFSAFRTGRLDCACGYSSDILVTQKEEAQRDIRGVKFGTSWSVNFLHFNTARPPLDNLKIRQALHIGFDRLLLRDIIRGGDAHYPPTFFVPEELGGKFSLSTRELLSTPGFRQPKQQDIDLAKQLFQEAGVDPAKVTVVQLGSTVQRDVNEAVANVLLRLGIQVKLDLIASTPDFTARQQRGDFDLFTTGGGNAFDDPADIITSSVGTGGGLNFGKISIPRVDQLLADQEVELDAAKRRALILDLQRELLNQAVFVPVHTFPHLYAVHPYVEGFVLKRAFVVGPAHRFERVWYNR